MKVRKYLTDYIKKMDDLISKEKVNQDILDDHLKKISFFQHERLIHLMVTISYALFLLLSIIITYYIHLFVIITYIVLIFLLFYVRHYFFLENSVQYMYIQYDKIKSLL